MDDKVPVDFYATNLVAVNQNSRVETTDDVYNQQGALIVPAGTEMRAEIAQKIISHKLSRPIELCISVTDSVDGIKLAEHFLTLPSLPEVIELLRYTFPVAELQNESRKLDRYPLLKQKLTVMRIRFPELYKKTVMGTYLALLLCHELKLDSHTTHCVFIAGLARDIGKLHIDPVLFLESGTMSNEQWNMLQGHVAISFHILKLIPDIPLKVREAVLEHHERADGFGYPLGKIEADLSLEGQIVAFADMFIALFNKYIHGLGYSVQALVPIIQVNAGIHKHENSLAVLRLFQKHVTSMRLKHSIGQFPTLVSHLAEIHPTVDLLLLEIEELNSLLVSQHLNEALRRTTQMVNALKSLFITSGITDRKLIDWFKELDFQNAKNSECLEIEKFALMLNEGIYKLGELLKNLLAALQNLSIEDDDKLQYLATYARINRRLGIVKRTMESTELL